MIAVVHAPQPAPVRHTFTEKFNGLVDICNHQFRANTI